MRLAGSSSIVLIIACAVAGHAQEVASVEISPAHASVVAGETARFTATVRDAGGDELAAAEVHWLATPFLIAGADASGLVSTTRPGQVYVLAIADGVIGVAMLDIAERPVAEIEITGAGGAEIVVGSALELALIARTEVGDPVSDVQADWRSERPGVAEVTGGVVIGRSTGEATIVARAEGHESRVQIRVVENPWTSIEVVSGAPEGVRVGDVVRLSVKLSSAESARLDAELSGGRGVAWSVSGAGARVSGDGRFVAERPGGYLVRAAVGDLSAATVVDVAPRNDPRRVEHVAFAPIAEGVQAAELWLSGDALYMSTIAGAVYVYDISDPASPSLADSMILDARLLNDISTTADGRIGVISREGASTRRNGIVLFDASSPLHPEVVGEFTEGLTGGTHSAYIYESYAFVTDDVTGSLRIIDIGDPSAPRQVARWAVEREVLPDYPVEFLNITPSRYLHDVYVADGIAYLAYWRDGLKILDVGNGIKGGSITDPQLVSEFRYNHAELYPPDYIAGTHAVFRQGDYVFLGDESYIGIADLHSQERFATRGLLHVVDVSDIENPVKVAEYDPVEFGVHNVYAEDDVLYMGAYNGGIRVLDVSGELMGDLREQGRLIGGLYTGSLTGFRPNMALTWSAIPHNGYIFASDINTGLWVARLTSTPVP